MDSLEDINKGVRITNILGDKQTCCFHGVYLRSLFVDNELGHGVGNLLEQDGSETRVETSEDTLLLQDSRETAQQTVSERRLRDL
jgi:hypothetical protein